MVSMRRVEKGAKFGDPPPFHFAEGKITKEALSSILSLVVNVETCKYNASAFLTFLSSSL